MNGGARHNRLWYATALITFAAVTGFALWVAFAKGDFAARAPFALIVAGINLAAMLFALRNWSLRQRSTQYAYALQWLSALALGVVLPVDFTPIYTVVWIGMAARLLPFNTLWVMLGITMFGWLLIMHFVWQDDRAIVAVLLFGTFHLFALLSGWNAREAENARDELAAANRELVATQHLLSEAARQGERTRIARNLHDLLGHHLTALSLQLQIAERKASGEVLQAVAESRALTRLLLSDVRETVSTLREGDSLDVKQAIESLASGAPGLSVHVDIDPALAIVEVDIAESLTRCVQEAITNTLRHANASECWITLSRNQDQIVLTVQDDGVAEDPLREGNGLRGMRERLAAVGGNLQLDTSGGSLGIRAEIRTDATT